MGPSMCSSFPVSRQCFFRRWTGTYPSPHHLTGAFTLSLTHRLREGCACFRDATTDLGAIGNSHRGALTETSHSSKHFVVILGGTTQFHLGGKPAFALQQPSLQLGSHLGIGVFFQFVQHHFTGVFKQIHGTPFLGTLVPQLAKFGLGVDTMDELVGMKWERFIHTRGLSSEPPSYSVPGLPIPPLRWSAPRALSLPPHVTPRSLSGYNPSTR